MEGNSAVSSIRRGWEGALSGDQVGEKDSQRPNVRGLSLMAVDFSDNLRRSVCYSSAEVTIPRARDPRVYTARSTKVNELDAKGTVDKDILVLDVPVRYANTVKIVYNVNDLCKYVAGLRLR